MQSFHIISGKYLEYIIKMKQISPVMRRNCKFALYDLSNILNYSD